MLKESCLRRSPVFRASASSRLPRHWLDHVPYLWSFIYQCPRFDRSLMAQRTLSPRAAKLAARKRSAGPKPSAPKHLPRFPAEPVAVVLSPAADLAVLPSLPAGLPVPASSQLAFERDGHVCLRGLLSVEEMLPLAAGLQQSAVAGAMRAARTTLRCSLGAAALLDDFGQPYSDEEVLQLVSELATAGAAAPFAQHFNLWRCGSPAAMRLASSPRLVHAAAALLGCPAEAVRLYQDCVFHKRPGDAPTRWHADAAMAPLDTNQFVTLWLPLTAVPADGSGLRYGGGSHRDVALRHWRHRDCNLAERYTFESHGALLPGDACAHHGWTLHGAPSLGAGELAGRMAYAVSYFIDGTRLLGDPFGKGMPGGSSGFDEDAESWAAWAAALGGGAIAACEAVPLALSLLREA